MTDSNSREVQGRFLNSQTFAVAGASTDREKYGNRVLRSLAEFIRHEDDRQVYPLNPHAEMVEGVKAYPAIAELPRTPDALSIVTPPAVTRVVVQEAIDAGVPRIWMQPGAEDEVAIALAEDAGVEVIAGGPCVLVAIKTFARS